MIHTRAPYRIFDCGGWTDTSFMPGGNGACCNIAVDLCVRIEYKPNDSKMLYVEHRTSGKTESINLPFVPNKKNKPETLAEAAVAALKLDAIHGGNIVVESDVPQGSGLGGSASYGVALLAALRPELLEDKHALAELAQELETKWLGNSCGTQDQMAASFGGISYSEINYPLFTHEAINCSPSFAKRLHDSLILIYTGESHFSSDMHQTVISELEKENPKVVDAFHRLKSCADEAADALRQADLTRYKEMLNANWQAQKDLHPNITTGAIEEVYETIKAIDPSLAFKGSGAGGGGSVGVLVEPKLKSDIVHTLETKFPAMKVWSDLHIDMNGAVLLPHTS
jgi:D-glycero-alpha-D-manno-heptose-7-phosphate kinase